VDRIPLTNTYINFGSKGIVQIKYLFRRRHRNTVGAKDGFDKAALFCSDDGVVHGPNTLQRGLDLIVNLYRSC
jgi:hypothetical protein